jgi:hypothetical protein
LDDVWVVWIDFQFFPRFRQTPVNQYRVIIAMQSDMPGMLEGLSAAQMKTKIKARGYQLMAELKMIEQNEAK